MQCVSLTADQFFPRSEAFHFTRLVLSRDPIRKLHTHDYFELFWVHHGTARHIVNGAKQKLVEGDVVFVRPKDKHALQGTGDETHVVNVIIRKQVAEEFAERHGLIGKYFWHSDELPTQVHRGIRELMDLSKRAMALEAAPKTLLSLEAFLAPLFSELISESMSFPANVPNWLSDACIHAQAPEVFRDGAAGLVRVSGRAHAHVSRSVKRYLGTTPTDYVNSVRMDYAARALRGSSDNSEDIARTCGVSNLSHFHKLFRENYGMTPHTYRRQYQKMAVQPV